MLHDDLGGLRLACPRLAADDDALVRRLARARRASGDQGRVRSIRNSKQVRPEITTTTAARAAATDYGATAAASRTVGAAAAARAGTRSAIAAAAPTVVGKRHVNRVKLGSPPVRVKSNEDRPYPRVHVLLWGGGDVSLAPRLMMQFSLKH